MTAVMLREGHMRRNRLKKLLSAQHSHAPLGACE